MGSNGYYHYHITISSNGLSEKTIRDTCHKIGGKLTVIKLGDFSDMMFTKHILKTEREAIDDMITTSKELEEHFNVHKIKLEYNRFKRDCVYNEMHIKLEIEKKKIYYVKKFLSSFLKKTNFHMSYNPKNITESHYCYFVNGRDSNYDNLEKMYETIKQIGNYYNLFSIVEVKRESVIYDNNLEYDSRFFSKL